MGVTFLLDEIYWRGQAYHSLTPKLSYDISHEFDQRREYWEEVYEWIANHIGECGDIWDGSVSRLYLNGGKIYFRDDRDLVLFLLRWT